MVEEFKNLKQPMIYYVAYVVEKYNKVSIKNNRFESQEFRDFSTKMSQKMGFDVIFDVADKMNDDNNCRLGTFFAYMD